MEGIYDVLLGGKKAGQAQIRKQGLYYYFDCVCRLSGEVVYKLTVSCGDSTESLGVFVPEDGQFKIKTRLAVKKLGEGTPVFRAVPRHDPVGEDFIPICPEEPFAYLARLENAYLARKNGTIGIRFR